MKSISISVLIATLLLGNGAFANEESTMLLSNSEKAVALLNAIETGDQQALGYVDAAHYTQHNLAVADGLAGFGELLQALPEGSARVKVVRAFEDGDFVFTHTDYNFFGPKVGFDLFRFNDGKIVEHWDNLALKAEQPNPSGRTQLDGSTALTDLAHTEANKALVTNFVQHVLVNAEYDKLGRFIDGEQYLQHNSMIADGLSGLAQAIDAMKAQGISMVYHKNHRVLGQGNFVLSISEGAFAGEPTSFYDLFRVENGKIVEHWDVLETLLPEAEWKNSNGKFGNL
ncbi:nuclear transport factor 2 family protein [Shewanella sp. AS16]|uniref:nuclear transport factor 2 family protein n=1 Tax=Shewanella sp. AS16 TaxID=2907625 RepID=UPI001F467F26|nr:nuclear transport factor 2 family protein [Shewanella sp. AS16]MCE9685491.1 nuclear transport factor 2 family protein [Shewanella sp. AS16]